MIDVKEEKNVYLSNFVRFEKELPRNGQSTIHRLRQTALKRFAELGFPGPRDEDWRFTSVASLAKIPFRPAPAAERIDLALEAIEKAAFPLQSARRLVFVDGHYAPALSALQPLPDGVILENLASVLDAHPDWVEPHLGRYAKFQDHAFTALNTAFIRDGAFISIQRARAVDEPIYLVFVTTKAGEGSVSHPRTLMVVGDNSHLTLVESYIALHEQMCFSNAVTEIALAPGAVVDHYKVLRESDEAFHVATTQVHQKHASNFSSHFISLGGGLIRNEVNAVLDGEGCECTLNGLYMATSRQHVDNRTVIDHAKPNCTSHELYKGILGGKAHGVFNGKIFVRQDAQKTDAKQTNQTLLLSDDAVINTKPQLEIFADDVRCTHGATVGQLQDEAIFYLCSRGISREAARSLLTYAFANDVVSRIRVEPIRAQLEDVLLTSQQLPHGPDVKEAL